jgi:hypothetical protein
MKRYYFFPFVKKGAGKEPVIFKGVVTSAENLDQAWALICAQHHLLAENHLDKRCHSQLSECTYEFYTKNFDIINIDPKDSLRPTQLDNILRALYDIEPMLFQDLSKETGISLAQFAARLDVPEDTFNLDMVDAELGTFTKFAVAASWLLNELQAQGNLDETERVLRVRLDGFPDARYYMGQFAAKAIQVWWKDYDGRDELWISYWEAVARLFHRTVCHGGARTKENLCWMLLHADDFFEMVSEHLGEKGDEDEEFAPA